MSETVEIIIGFPIAQYVFERFFCLRQYQVLKQTIPLKVHKNEVSQKVFDKSQAYGRAKPNSGLFGFDRQARVSLRRRVFRFRFDSVIRALRCLPNVELVGDFGKLLFWREQEMEIGGDGGPDGKDDHLLFAQGILQITVHRFSQLSRPASTAPLLITLLAA